MKVLICDKTEKEYIEQMRAAGLTVDVRDDITPEELMTIQAIFKPCARHRISWPLLPC